MAPFPSSFDVTEKQASSSKSASAEANTERFQAVGQSNEAKALKQLRQDVSLTVQLADVSAVSSDTLRSVLPQLSVPLWSEIVTERHLNGRCGLPTCSKAPSRPYVDDQTPQLKLSASGKVLDYKERAPYCSTVCLRKAKFLESSSIPQRKGELLEDVAPASLQRKSSKVSPLLHEGAPPSSPGSHDLVTNLPIVEHPISSQRPQAPLPGQADFEARSQRARPAPPPQQAQRRFILGKQMRTRNAQAQPHFPSQSEPASTSAQEPDASNTNSDEQTTEPPSLESLSLYDQAIDGAGSRGLSSRIKDDMNDDERAIWLLGRDLRDQLRVSGELS